MISSRIKSSRKNLLMSVLSVLISFTSNISLTNLRLQAFQVLLATLARVLGQVLAALLPGLRGTITRAVLGDSQDLATVRQLLTSLERAGPAVVRTVAVLGLDPIAAQATVDTVVVFGVEGGTGRSSRSRGRRSSRGRDRRGSEERDRSNLGRSRRSTGWGCR